MEMKAGVVAPPQVAVGAMIEAEVVQQVRVLAGLADARRGLLPSWASPGTR